MAGQENVKQLEECSVSNALGTWVFSVAGALLAIPVGIKRKSLAPLVFLAQLAPCLTLSWELVPAKRTRRTPNEAFGSTECCYC